jgi:alkylation response protein AidB-like acyl-CoA dehydrogenase
LRRDIDRLPRGPGSAASSAALRAANDGIQFHGGIGFTWEHPAHLYLKHAQSRQLFLGSADDQLHALADLIFD